MTTRGTDSQLGNIARNNQRNAGVIDTLSQLASGRATSPTRPPFNPKQDQDNPTAPGSSSALTRPVLGEDTSNVAPGGDTGGGLGSPLTSPLDAPTLEFQAPQNFNAALQESIISDEDFYSNTGRQPSQLDRQLMDSKRRFLLARGRLPSKQELLYEAQRGMVSTQDTSGVTL